MSKRMIVLLPLLLSSMAGATEAIEYVHEMARPPAVHDPAVTAPVSFPGLATSMAQGALHPDRAAVRSTIPCSTSCEASDTALVPSTLSRRTNRDTSGPLRRPGRDVGSLARPCGPSPLSARQIETLVERVATVHGVDPQLAKAVAWAESRFDRVRNSPKGARGPMQLMPATAVALGVTDICDPHENIDAGVRHLAQLLNQFGHPLLAVAAYNAGSRAVIDHKGIPPFAETLGYLARVVNRQLDLPSRARQAAGGLAAAQALPQSDMQGEGSGAMPHRFINGVMHLPSQGGS